MFKNSIVVRIAYRYFRAKKSEKFISVVAMFSLIGITIGVAALIVVMSVMNGFRQELTKGIIGINGDITITPGAASFSDMDLIQDLKGKEYIESANLVVTGQALAIGIRTNSGVVIKGIDITNLMSKKEIYHGLVAGSFEGWDVGDIAIGLELARVLGAKVGSKIKLISSSSVSSIVGSIPRSKVFTVSAIFSSSMYDYDIATVLMPISISQKFFGLSEFSYNLIEIYTKNPQISELYAQDLANSISHDFYISTWKTSNQQFLNALKIERAAMMTILSLIILVAAFNIVSNLFMMVNDKKSDIAILRTIGASKCQIMLIFVLNGFFVGLLGTLFGTSLGILVSYNIQNIRLMLESLTGIKVFEAAIYFLYSLPAETSVKDIVIVSSISLVLSLLASLYPSYRASKLNPVEALRYE